MKWLDDNAWAIVLWIGVLAFFWLMARVSL